MCDKVKGVVVDGKYVRAEVLTALSTITKWQQGKDYMSQNGHPQHTTIPTMQGAQGVVTTPAPN
ncbi:UNVERIFIED_CONTAM: hypothetical protein FKN15_045475 [Acipenser sinensis]